MADDKRARHLGRSRRRRTGLALFSAILVVALVVGWSVDRILSRTLPSDPSSPADGSASATASPHEDTAALQQGSSSGLEESPAERCAGDVADVEAAVRAAHPGVDHWRTHVRARTDMLSGRITPRRMEAIYARTQSLGPEDHRRFAVAVSGIQRQTPCQELRRVAAQAASGRDDDCLVRSRSAAAALAAARSTMDEWQTHLHHMEQYADGGMRTGKALRLWVRAWRKAPEGISAFDRAVRDLAAAPSCAAG